MKFPAIPSSRVLVLVLVFAWVAAAARAAVPVIDDAALWQTLADVVGKDAAAGQAVAPPTLRAQLSKPSRTPVRLARPGRREISAESLYLHATPSVVAIAAVYKCDKCGRWHTAGTASGWVIGDHGEIATNYHVVADDHSTNLLGFGIVTRDGRAFPVRGILWADRARDVAVLRTDATGLVPLPVERDEAVGRPVSVIAHPGGNLFTLTQGHVARYMKRSVEPALPAVEWMCVTADYAVGSSGGPVLNSRGSVVGMVSRTQTISADPHNAATTQMVVKMTVPASAVLDAINAR